MKAVIPALFLAVTTFLAHAQSNYTDLEFGARKTWSTFECVELANWSGNAPEYLRLVNYGLEQGRAFLKPVLEGKANPEHMPVGVALLLRGPRPSADFLLGRLWEQAGEEAMHDIEFGPDHMMLPVTVVRQSASVKFADKNCALVGH